MAGYPQQQRQLLRAQTIRHKTAKISLNLKALKTGIKVIRADNSKLCIQLKALSIMIKMEKSIIYYMFIQLYSVVYYN